LHNAAVRFGIGIAVAALVAGCGSSSSAGGSPGASPEPTPPAASLVGAGATFPAPVYTAAFYAYNQKYPQLQVNYQSIGSGAGIQQFDKGTVDFGASDVPAKDTDLPDVGGTSGVLQIPVVLGTEGLAYNISGVADGQLKLTPTTICGIVLGAITSWNDPALAADNRGLSLPSAKISFVHRSDGSGTTYIFSDFLSKTCADFKTRVGTGKSLNWPTGVGAKGNEAVASTIKNTPNSIGYVELAYIVQTGMTQAKLKNHDGNFVLPSPAGATAAASAVPNPTATNFSIVDAPGANSAPISGYSWLLVLKQQKDAIKGRALIDLLDWFTAKSGQKYASNLKYAPLPQAIQSNDLTLLKTVTGPDGKAFVS
jgi:phosphate transport system substrate-binding protein